MGPDEPAPDHAPVPPADPFPPSEGGVDGDALPVVVEVAGEVGAQVRAHVEAALGWQVVDAADGAWMRPRLRLADGAGPSAEGEFRSGPGPGAAGAAAAVPTIAILAGEQDPVSSARAVLGLGASDVVAWPAGRDALGEVARRVLVGAASASAFPAVRATATDHLVLAGAAGGVGTTTVALALGGLASWLGRDVLVIASGDVAVPDVPSIAGDALDGPGLWGVARVVPAAPRLRVVRRHGARAVGAPVRGLPAGTLVVEDAGVQSAAATILVARRDRGGAEALATTTAGAVVLLDEGPLPEAQVLAGLAGGTVVVLPRSVRVASAGVLRRVPGALPGTWLEPLRSLLPAG